MPVSKEDIKISSVTPPKSTELQKNSFTAEEFYVGQYSTSKFCNGWILAINKEGNVLMAGSLLPQTTIHFVIGSVEKNSKEGSGYCTEVTNAFFVSKQTIEKLNIKTDKHVQILCTFAGNCYDFAPIVIEQMAQGDFHVYKEFQEKLAINKTLEELALGK